jgi:hypothetical protein
LPQRLGVTLNGAQRLAQVVRYRETKGLQRVVGVFELTRALEDALFQFGIQAVYLDLQVRLVDMACS